MTEGELIGKALDWISSSLECSGTYFGCAEELLFKVGGFDFSFVEEAGTALQAFVEQIAGFLYIIFECLVGDAMNMIFLGGDGAEDDYWGDIDNLPRAH
jgi:hypothetical protein